MSDRISMGDVRGDVLHLGFIQTTIMEMGQPPSVQSADPAMWVKSRQFTGRIVTVGNAQIFKEPVINYTRDFRYIWKKMVIPITYQADRARVESIMLAPAAKHAVDADSIAAQAMKDLQERFGVTPIDLVPKVFFRITDNRLELTVRFLVDTHGVRNLNNAMSRVSCDSSTRPASASPRRPTTSSASRRSRSVTRRSRPERQRSALFLRPHCGAALPVGAVRLDQPPLRPPAQLGRAARHGPGRVARGCRHRRPPARLRLAPFIF